MKHNIKLIIASLGVLYFIMGVFVWSGFRVVSTPFFEQISNFALIALLWPLLLGIAMFYTLAFPAILVFVIALVLALKRQHSIAISLFLTILLLLSSLFMPITIKNQKDLSSVTMGLPTHQSRLGLFH